MGSEKCFVQVDSDGAFGSDKHMVLYLCNIDFVY